MLINLHFWSPFSSWILISNQDFLPKLQASYPSGSLPGYRLDNSSKPIHLKLNSLAFLPIRSSDVETTYPPGHLTHGPLEPGYTSFRTPPFLSTENPTVRLFLAPPGSVSGYLVPLFVP